MANICDNTLRVYTEDYNNINYIKDFFNSIGDIEEISNNDLEIYFDSRWSFPEELMDKLYNNLPNKQDIDMTCLSIEWGCFYCAFHHCDENGWTLN